MYNCPAEHMLILCRLGFVGRWISETEFGSFVIWCVVNSSPKNMPTLRCSKNPDPPHPLVLICAHPLFQVLGVCRLSAWRALCSVYLMHRERQHMKSSLLNYPHVNL